MSNSSLVNVTVKSPNHSGARTHSIDRITPHCVVGYLTASGIGNCFTSSSVQASCNYGIGKDGMVCLCVDEGNRSWCTSSNANDQRAVTIECASGTTYPYTIPDATYQTLIKLCADICQRNGKKKLLWLGSKEKTMSYDQKADEMVLTAHRWFAAKECPGQYLYSRLGDLADKVNAILGTNSDSNGTTESEPEWYRVRLKWSDASSQIGAYTSLENAKAACPAGYTVYDSNGKAVYTAESDSTTSYSGDTDTMWFGWTKRETGSAGLRCIHGDAGKAYGLQFDYRYGLVPFMKYCVEYNSKHYSGFQTYINLGAGNSKLIYNNGLGKLWQQYYDSYTAEFEQLQYTCAYQNYYVPAREYIQKNYGYDIGSCHPVVKGTLWSMAFRSGSQTAAKKFASCKGKGDESILNTVYASYGTADSRRWTKAGQWGDALTALKNNTYGTVYKTLKSSSSDKTTSEWVGIVKAWEKKMIEVEAIYSNKSNKTNYAEALKQSPVRTNCALFVVHALQQFGMLDTSYKFYGAKGGDLKGNGRNKIKEVSTIYEYGTGKKVSDVSLRVGDIVTYYEGHTNVYLGLSGGKRQWSDAGRGTTKDCAEGSTWSSFRKSGDMSGYTVAKVIRLNITDDSSTSSSSGTGTTSGSKYVVQAGAYSKKANADAQAKKIIAKGFEAIVKQRDNDYYIQCGVFSDKTKADSLVKQLVKAGFDAILRTA